MAAAAGAVAVTTAGTDVTESAKKTSGVVGEGADAQCRSVRRSQAWEHAQG